MRDLSPSFAAAVAASVVAPACMVYLDLDGDPVYIWTGVGVLDWAGHAWQGIGSFGGIDPIEEYSETRAGTSSLVLNGVPNHTLPSVRDAVYKDRKAEIHLALFNTETAELIGVELLVRAQMDVMKITRSPEKSTIKLTIVNELVRLRETWSSLYTDPHQQALHPGDTSLRFVASIQDLKIRI
jgi:hypothetical protein